MQRLLFAVVVGAMLFATFGVATAAPADGGTTMPAANATEDLQDSGEDLETISYGETKSGELDRDDETGPRGPEEYVTFQGEAGDEISVTMEVTSEEPHEDPYMFLSGPDGNQIVRSEIGPDPTTLPYNGSTITLPEDGQYTIRTTSTILADRDEYDIENATFEYDLTLEQEGGETTDSGGETTDSGGDGQGIDLRSIDLGETAEGELEEGDPESAENRGRHEPVTFQGEAGQVVTITMTSSDDPYLILRGPDGEEIARNDDSFEVGDLNSRIGSVELPSNGEYTIVATSYDEIDSFQYELTLEQGEATDDGDDFTPTRTPTEGEQVLEEDQNEPNDSCDGATQAEFGSSYDGLTIDSSSDQDYYAVDLESGQGVTASIDFSHSEGDIDMAITPPGSSFPADSSTSISDGETVSTTAEESGTYCIRVYGFSGDTASYSLSIEEGATDEGDDFTPTRTPTEGEQVLEEDQNEPNDSCDGATQAEFGSSYEELTIDSSSDEDYYAVELEEGQGVTASIDFSHSEGDIDLELQGPDGSSLDTSASVSDGETVSATADQSGIYCIRVYGFMGATADYSLSIEEGATEDDGGFTPTEGRQVFEPDRNEPNDECEGATRAELGASYDGLNIGTASDSDYYAVELEEGQGVTASIDFSHSQGDIDMEIFGPDSEYSLESSISVTDGETVSVNADQSGTYCIRVYGYIDATARYSLNIQEGAQEEDDFGGEGNQTSSGLDLRSIEVGETREGSIDSEDPSSEANRGTHEPVTFQGEAGQTVTIDMESEAGDTYLLLQGPNGEVIAENDDGGAGLNSRIEGVELPSSGEYTIIATSFWSGSTFDYTLSLQAGGSSGGGDIGQSETTDLSVSPVQATPGGTATVTYELANTAEETRGFVLRSGLTELPPGWELSGHSDDGGTWRSSDRTWLFQEIDAGGEANPTATLQVPDDVETGETYTFRASALTQNSDSAVRSTATVTVEIRETTLAQAVDQNDNGQIDDLEILDAIGWWQNQEEVPGYGDTISDLQILDLIEMWQEGTEVGGGS